MGHITEKPAITVEYILRKMLDQKLVSCNNHNERSSYTTMHHLKKLSHILLLFLYPNLKDAIVTGAREFLS